MGSLPLRLPRSLTRVPRQPTMLVHDNANRTKLCGRVSMTVRLAATIALAAGLSIADASAQQQPTNPIDAFLARAKAAAGFDFTGTLVRLCVYPQTAPGADVAPAAPPA